MTEPRDWALAGLVLEHLGCQALTGVELEDCAMCQFEDRLRVGAGIPSIYA